MTSRCSVPDCHVVAEIVLADPEGIELDMCREHGNDAIHRSGGDIHGVRLIRRPHCFLTGCDAAAAAVLEDREGLPRPVCLPHWDDLSWIDGRRERTLLNSPRRLGPSRVGAARWSRD